MTIVDDACDGDIDGNNGDNVGLEESLLCYDDRWGQSLRRKVTGDSRMNLLQIVEQTFDKLSKSRPLNSEEEQKVLLHVSATLKKTYKSFSEMHGEHGLIQKLLRRSIDFEAQRKAHELLLEKNRKIIHLNDLACLHQTFSTPLVSTASSPLSSDLGQTGKPDQSDHCTIDIQNQVQTERTRNDNNNHDISLSDSESNGEEIENANRKCCGCYKSKSKSKSK